MSESGYHPRGDARNAILRSARALFGSTGYHGTSVRDVAQHAEVSEALVYRYFGAKAALFNEAVRVPYRGFIDEFLDEWLHLDVRLSNAEMVTRLVSRLYDFVLENRDLIFALAAANRFGDTEIDEAGALSEGVRQMADVTAAEADARGLAHVDLEMAGSCTVALVIAMGILDDLLFPTGNDRPSRERLVREMSKYATAGVEQQPHHATQPTGAADRPATLSDDSTRPDENEQLGHARRLAHTRPIEAIALITNATNKFRDAQASQREAVATARAAGVSWADIGAAAGMTRQSAHERWADPRTPKANR